MQAEPTDINYTYFVPFSSFFDAAQSGMGFIVTDRIGAGYG